jgi:hypothetical protein
MRCEVVAIGTELLLGIIVDSNSAWIGEQLALAGIDSYFQVKVGDLVVGGFANRNDIVRSKRRRHTLGKRSDQNGASPAIVIRCMRRRLPG